MKLTPENFVDGIKSIQFEHNSELWLITYAEKVREGNGWNYLKPKLRLPADKTDTPLDKVFRHFTEDTVTIIYS